MAPPPHCTELQLQRENATLAIKLLKVNSERRIKQIYCQRLEYLFHERLTKIDQLTGVIDQLRSANQKLGLQNEILAAMIAAPQLGATQPAQKLDQA